MSEQKPKKAKKPKKEAPKRAQPLKQEPTDVAKARAKNKRDPNDPMNKEPTDARLLEKMTKEQLLEEVLQERQRRVHWEKKKKANLAAKSRLEKMTLYSASIDKKLNELQTESEFLEVEKEVIAGEFEAQKAAQQDDFCQKVCDLERQMDNKEIQWYIQSCEMRDDDVVAANEHLLKEDEVLDNIDEIKRVMEVRMARLKAEKQGYQRKTKIELIHKDRIEALKEQLRERKHFTDYGGSSHGNTSLSHKAKHPPSAHFSHDAPSEASTPSRKHSRHSSLGRKPSHTVQNHPKEPKKKSKQAA